VIASTVAAGTNAREHPPEIRRKQGKTFKECDERHNC
jgi:hypothetical protein